jgi:hypothetical protein
MIKLKVLQNDNIVKNETCFSVQSKHNVDCKREKCPNWVNNSAHNNCVIIAAQDGPRTLQDVGNFFNLTRMRICQIDKSIQEKLIKYKIK